MPANRRGAVAELRAPISRFMEVHGVGDGSPHVTDACQKRLWYDSWQYTVLLLV